ncbi:MAG: hybrid sensor histidine kinase/response regulator [Vicinamibacterales bacterium]
MLVVEDSERLRRTVGEALKNSGYAVDLADNGIDGLWLAQSNPYDAVVLDIMLPALDGLDVLKELRAAGSLAHILMLTARDTVEDRVRELTPIAERLNDLLSRLERSFERERQFSSDLAHELRTPIAELRTGAELALKWPEHRDGRTDRDTLQIALRLEGIVTRLLQLIRGQSDQRAESLQPIAIEPMLRSVWDGLADRASAKHVHVMWIPSVGASIDADPVLLRSVLGNLLENAVEYVPDRGAVEIGWMVDGTGFSLHVTNDVEALAEADVNRLFDRFWRKDPARAGTGHYGLGLSIARAFARAMGCELRASMPGSGRLTLTLSGQASDAVQG